jgi:hypothetical protein
MGLIDILNPYNFASVFERAFKTYVSGKDPDSLSVMQPLPYAQRFQSRISTRVLARTAFAESQMNKGRHVSVTLQHQPAAAGGRDGEGRAVVCLAPRLSKGEPGLVHKVVWVGEPSPAAERLSMISVGEGLNGEVVLSNGHKFINPVADL